MVNSTNKQVRSKSSLTTTGIGDASLRLQVRTRVKLWECHRRQVTTELLRCSPRDMTQLIPATEAPQAALLFDC